MESCGYTNLRDTVEAPAKINPEFGKGPSLSKGLGNGNTSLYCQCWAYLACEGLIIFSHYLPLVPGL